MYKTIKQKYSLFFFFKLILPVFQLSSNKKHIKNIKPNETANNSFLYLFPNGNIGIYWVNVANDHNHAGQRKTDKITRSNII